MTARQCCTMDLFIQSAEAMNTTRPYEMDFKAYNITPRKSWLSEDSKKKDWSSSSMNLDIRDRFIALNAEFSKCSDSIQEHSSTGKQLAWLTRERNCNRNHALVRLMVGESSYYNEHPKRLRKLLSYCSNILPKELPSELPVNRKKRSRGMAKLKMGPVYKLPGSNYRN